MRNAFRSAFMFVDRKFVKYTKLLDLVRVESIVEVISDGYCFLTLILIQRVRTRFKPKTVTIIRDYLQKEIVRELFVCNTFFNEFGIAKDLFANVID